MTQEERQKALEAGRILKSEVFREVFRRLDERCVGAWRGAKSAEEREECWRRQQSLESVRRELMGELQNAVLREQGRDARLNEALQGAKDADKPEPRRQ